ncbi:wound-induced protein 1-like [Phalaenopsis equestris]|uniref:wound-induced protein 1-like n=1 Tax=Phalaenopsis equestris TaxID=78828 RepID=UPI0009E4E1C0|nr:wound-induced protein 1-like [Phalaenopsis equestris]
MNEKKTLVLNMYQSLSTGDMNKAAALLAGELEWRFHGPPGREHMMRILTGVENQKFRFRPRREAELGKWVVVEGWELSGEEEDYWVHAWVVEGGVITQFREYFNTSVTVRVLGGPATGDLGEMTLWKSRAGRPLPGLVLPV